MKSFHFTGYYLLMNCSTQSRSTSKHTRKEPQKRDNKSTPDPVPSPMHYAVCSEANHHCNKIIISLYPLLNGSHVESKARPTEGKVYALPSSARTELKCQFVSFYFFTFHSVQKPKQLEMMLRISFFTSFLENVCQCHMTNFHLRNVRMVPKTLF